MFKGTTEPVDCETTSGTSIRTGITYTVYNADEITVTDPANKARKQRRDALGRTVPGHRGSIRSEFDLHFGGWIDANRIP